MNEQIIEIKEKRSNFLVKGFIYLILTVIALSCTLMPYLVGSLFPYKLYFFLIGGLAFVGLTILFVLHIYSECKPSNALIITETGYTDYINSGDYEIQWTNVRAVKILGRQGSKYLGISLDNSDIVLDNVKSKYADTIRDNLDDNLPAIIIDQDDVRIPLGELKDIFSKHINEARKISNEVCEEKPKNNPFTTEDVLRAFGQLNDSTENPEEVISKEETQVTDENDLVSETVDELVLQPNPEENVNFPPLDELSFESNEFFDDLTKFTSTPEDTDISLSQDDNVQSDETISTFTIENEGISNTEEAIPELDSSLIFLSTNKKEPSAESTPEQNESININNLFGETNSEAIAIEENTIPEETTNNMEASSASVDDEIEFILSRAKSTKISEIEKILSEKDVPYSLSRDIPTENKAQNETQNKAEPTNTASDDLSFNFSDVQKNEPTQTDSFELSLDDLIQQALNDNEKSTSNDDEYPELIIFDD